jgi:hypothetical protein
MEKQYESLKVQMEALHTDTQVAPVKNPDVLFPSKLEGV